MDFSNSDDKKIEFYINAKNIDKHYVFDYILIEGYNIQIKVEVLKRDYFSASLSKKSYENPDSGFLIIRNNMLEDLKIEVSTNDSIVKFGGKKYFVGRYAEIPFTVKIPSLQLAQFALRKQPVTYTEIYVRSLIGTNLINRRLVLPIGQIGSDK